MPARRTSPLLIAVVAVLALVVGVWVGGHPHVLPAPVRPAFLADDVLLQQLALDTIERDYYRPTSRDALVDDGLAGTVKSLNDRFSMYLDPSSYARFDDATKGRFSGVGMEVAEIQAGLRVSRVFPRSPAARAGIRRGEEIVAVNGRSLAGKSSRVSTGLIRGRPGTTVTLTVRTGQRRRQERLRRARISAPSVTSSSRTVGGRRIGVVGLSSFTEGAHGEVGRAMARQRASGAEAILLDLRDNGGGLLSEAVLVASLFIPEGTIVSTRGRSRPRQVFTASGPSIPHKVPVLVLVNDASASASEIVAGALQDRDRARVAGVRTFGKGVFQEVRELPNGGALDLTVGEYFLPSGRNLGGGGVRKGSGVRPDLAARDDPATVRDEALDVALRALAASSR